jgi:hypothetical protein
VAGICEYGKEPLGSIKFWKFIDSLQRPVRFSRMTVLCGVSE